MRYLLRHTALAALLVGTAGCAQTFDATTLGVPATLASEGAAVPAGTSFKVSAKALWAAWGLVPITEPSLKKILASQLVDGRSVANVRITTRASIFDAIISLGTLGVLAPRSVTIEGVVVGGAPATP